jgi:hypothetical protein
MSKETRELTTADINKVVLSEGKPALVVDIDETRGVFLMPVELHVTPKPCGLRPFWTENKFPPAKPYSISYDVPL